MTHLSRIIIAILLIGASFPNEAKANIIIQFEEIGGNVVATTSGSITRPLTNPASTYSGGGSVAGSFRSLYYVPGTVSLFTGVGNYTDTHMFYGPTSASGDAFGFSSTNLYLPSGLTAGETYSPETTWVWSGKTLANLTLNLSTPIEAFEFGDQTITFAFTPVPEPSTLALLFVGAAAAFVVRRKKRAGRLIYGPAHNKAVIAPLIG